LSAGGQGGGPGARLRELETRARKALGQHFLASPDMAARIVALAELRPGDPVLEIGPGLGALTGPLLERGVRLVAVERDEVLAEWIEARWPQVELTRADAMKLDWTELLPGHGWACVANLPYNLGTHLVGRMLRCPGTFHRLVVMMQREVAERIVARPGNKAYGALSVELQARAQARLVMRLRPGAFHPPPKVDSAVLRLDVLPDPLLGGADPQHFDRTVRAAFGQRRKTLRNALGARFGRERAQAALLESGIDPGWRAERLDLQAFGRLARALS